MKRKENAPIYKWKKYRNKERDLTATIEKRKPKLYDHIIKHNNFVSNILQGNILGKKGSGRPPEGRQ